MAHYIFVITDDDTQTVTHVTADHRNEAARKFFAESNVEEATLFRVVSEPVRVRVEREMVERVVVE